VDSDSVIQVLEINTELIAKEIYVVDKDSILDPKNQKTVIEKLDITETKNIIAENIVKEMMAKSIPGNHVVKQDGIEGEMPKNAGQKAITNIQILRN